MQSIDNTLTRIMSCWLLWGAGLPLVANHGPCMHADACVCVLWWMPAVRHRPKVLVVTSCSAAMVTNMPGGGMGSSSGGARHPRGRLGS